MTMRAHRRSAADGRAVPQRDRADRADRADNGDVTLPAASRPPEPRLHTLANGVQVLALPLPHAETAAVSVFVRSGSAHEAKRLNGISHVVEHMAFKGTATRDVQRINLDAERLGADVNAHTDRDHTAFHMRGRARDAEAFVAMLGDIVIESTFPDAELDREREVILSEMADDADDALTIVDQLFDKVAFGTHPFAQPIVGTAHNIRRISRDDLADYVEAQYTGPNVVVGVAGRVDADAFARAAERAFGAMRGGAVNTVPPVVWQGGSASRAQAGNQQSHVVLGYPGVPVTDPTHAAHALAAAVFGDGMSSPLLDEIRERRGLAYSLGCAAESSSLAGSFVIDASLAPARLDEFLRETRRLLLEHAGSVGEVSLERARNLLAVRRLRDAESPARRLEHAVLDLFAFGRVREAAEVDAAYDAVGTGRVRDTFAALLAQPVALALSGQLAKGALERARAVFA